MKEKESAPPDDSQQHVISGYYDKDIAYFKNLFQQNDPIQFRELQIGEEEKRRACLVFCDGLIDSMVMDSYLIRPLLNIKTLPDEKEMLDYILTQVVELNNGKAIGTKGDIVKSVAYGEAVLIVDGLEEALLCDVKRFNVRSITEPEGEKVINGPREGFTEVLMMNLAMVRRKLRTEDLKMCYYSVGKRTNTQLCIAYVEGLAKPEVLSELYKRLDTIDIDGVLDSNYITELIRDKPWSSFRSVGYTERPDVVAAKLLEGRIAIFVDGTPVVLTVPYLFIENFQSNEDYYLDYGYASFSRCLRIFGFILTILVPAIYIAIVAYHQEVLPSPILISVTVERKSVPLPAALEAFIMLLAFEILLETGFRMQTNVGQAVGIVGALVIGQAAVEASMIAAPMIIVVALSGITSLLVPKLTTSVLPIRFAFLFLASVLGFFGIVVGLALMLTHMLSLYSFGIWQLSSDRELGYQQLKDAAIRASWRDMLTRPQALTTNKTRQKRSREGKRP